jgi:hypothetical protein
LEQAGVPLERMIREREMRVAVIQMETMLSGAVQVELRLAIPLLCRLAIPAA